MTNDLRPGSYLGTDCNGAPIRLHDDVAPLFDQWMALTRRLGILLPRSIGVNDWCAAHGVSRQTYDRHFKGRTGLVPPSKSPNGYSREISLEASILHDIHAELTGKRVGWSWKRLAEGER